MHSLHTGYQKNAYLYAMNASKKKINLGDLILIIVQNFSRSIIVSGNGYSESF